MTQVWVVDANLWIDAARCNRGQRLVKAARIDTCLPDVVYDEVQRHTDDSDFLHELNELTVEIPAESPTAAHYHRIRSARSSGPRNAGEDACIALALENAHLTFVTHDQGAQSLAMRELGERVLGGHNWLRSLAEQGRLEKRDAIAIGNQSRNQPYFWQGWSNT